METRVGRQFLCAWGSGGVLGVQVARYRLRIVEPPKVPVEKNPSPDNDGPTVEPNLWMWVNPNIVFPPGKLEVPEPRKGEDQPSTLPSPQPPPKEEDLADCSSEATAGESESLPSSSEQSPPRKRMRFASSPSTWELAEEEAADQDDSSSVALPSPHKRAPLQSQRPRQASSQEGRLWSRPPLNYFHLIALALRNSSPCGLNVQQIYNFTRYVPPGALGGGQGPWSDTFQSARGPGLLPWFTTWGRKDKCAPRPPFSGTASGPQMCVHVSCVWEGIHAHSLSPLKNPTVLYLSFCFFLKILFIYLREREGAQAGGAAEGETDSLLSREPDVGLDPRTLGS
uniref:Forkhead box R1 n=1 Tax=Ailuropoda melanoleuca TaxID=9646 RepID=A0A7N5K9F0_AILME